MIMTNTAKDRPDAYSTVDEVTSHRLFHLKYPQGYDIMGVQIHDLNIFGGSDHG